MECWVGPIGMLTVVSGEDNWAECRVGLMTVVSGQDNWAQSVGSA